MDASTESTRQFVDSDWKAETAHFGFRTWQFLDAIVEDFPRDPTAFGSGDLA